MTTIVIIIALLIVLCVFPKLFMGLVVVAAIGAGGLYMVYEANNAKYTRERVAVRDTYNRALHSNSDAVYALDINSDCAIAINNVIKLGYDELDRSGRYDRRGKPRERLSQLRFDERAWSKMDAGLRGIKKNGRLPYSSSDYSLPYNWPEQVRLVAEICKETGSNGVSMLAVFINDSWIHASKELKAEKIKIITTKSGVEG